MKNGYASPSSSPPTPPSPLPISVGPGHQKYSFSSSPSPSPPFSPPPSSHTSAENIPLLDHNLPIDPPREQPSAFSLDRQDPDQLEPKNSCLKNLLEWLVLRCCSCNTWSVNLPSNPIKKQTITDSQNFL
ncbi:protein PROLINE CONTENT ALTERNATIVE 22 [Cornus florida]|uniref:protein PROLINE CONTENT ALTERNATIVE 22 n=1 Tax=Cornus florida TaxID=4283 RepID=UPI0028A121B3|nr:protein PROLINE CONTENT ALTERNATIVE 22 [Cornus florida]